MKNTPPFIFQSIAHLHQALNCGEIKHPLISVIRLEEMDTSTHPMFESFMYQFYTVFLKKNFDGKIKYGQQYYDFDSGTMTFYAPKQLITIEDYTPSKIEGWMLAFHPDLIQSFPLGTKIKGYGFFDYAANEALHLSTEEEQLISTVMKQLQEELTHAIDAFSQEVMLAQIDLLLTYCNRFFNRQFLTRKKVSNDILTKFESLLNSYFEVEELKREGLPSVCYFADQLKLTSSYLNDLLKNLTGQTTQQHIHYFLLNRAKELLATTDLSVAEIAYALGFEYPQSFNKLFKNKTGVSPLHYRNSLN